ncbi:MAG: TIGR04283 family arsenosugar biosynthesis glycosyltransferase [Atopobiaceae bacterium]
MKLSVVVPVLNEEARIPQLLADLEPWAHAGAEIIFVDGGSRDKTLELLGRSHHRLIVSAPGRGLQCRVGIERAAGDAVLILHSDSTPDASAFLALKEALERGAMWGCMRMRFDSSRWVYRAGALVSNLRVRFFGIAFGDQGMFFTKEALRASGGFPALALMEDYELSRRLRRLSRPCVLPCHITTSARRFEVGGPIKTALLMRKLRRMYRAGTDSAELARLYRAGEKNVQPAAARPAAARPASLQQGSDSRPSGSSRLETTLILFTRLPRAGVSKTRLAASIGDGRAARLQWAMAEDLVERLSPSLEHIAVYLTDAGKNDSRALRARFESTLKDVCDTGCDLSFYKQEGEGIGERMHRAMSAELTRARACMLMGSDLPAVCSGDLRAASAELADHDVVLAPSADGGYWLVGMKSPHKEMFELDAYSTKDVYQQTCDICHELGISVGKGPLRADIDTVEDLVCYLDELAHHPDAHQLVSSRTARLAEDYAKHQIDSGKTI